jgi:hypothetical protein
MTPVTLKQVFLVHHTHMDVGYTDLAGEVRNQQLGHLDQVLALCRDNAARPPEERFFWTCESALLVRDYLEARPLRRAQELLHALRQGWIELQAFLTQPLTELASAQELVDCLGYACDLGRREGFEVRCGMIDDIGGYTGRLPSVMAQMNVPYLVVGVGAFQVHLPWADLPHLFYLRAKDGGRVLVWNLGIDRRKRPQQMTQLAAVYGQGTLYLVMPFQRALSGAAARGVELDVAHDAAATSARERFGELEERLAGEAYPFAEVLLQYGGDNGGPDPQLPALIRAIRQRDDMPTLHFTTPVHFFRHMEQTYGPQIPVIDGVITDPWNLRANPAPGTLRRQREAQRLLETVAARQALFEPVRPAERARLEDAALRLQLGSDHTCGLSEWGWEKTFSRSAGCRDEAFDRYRQSWQDKRQYAEQAGQTLREIERVQRQRLASRRAGSGPLVAVWNDSAATHGGECELYLGRGFTPLSALYDLETGAPVAFQPLGASRYLLDSPAAPAFGLRFLRPEFGAAAPAPQRTADPCCLRGGGLELRLDGATGRVLSLRHLATATELLDAEAADSLGNVVCHDLGGVSHGVLEAGMQQTCTLRQRPARFVGIEAGPAGALFSSCILRTFIDGPRGPIRSERTLCLYHAAPRVEVLVRVDKPENENKESVSVVFPWAGRGGAFSFDQNLGAVDPHYDLAPGAMQDLFYGCSWAHLWAGAWGVTLACPDAPLLQFGGLRFTRWDDRLPFTADSNHILCQLYHNLLNTDCPVWQEMLDTFRFSLFVHTGSQPSVGQRHRLAAAARPLHADYLPTPADARSRPLGTFDLSPDEVRLLSVRGRQGDLRLLLENTASASVRTTIQPGVPLHTAWLQKLDGTRLAACDVDAHHGRLAVTLLPHQIAVVRIQGKRA